MTLFCEILEILLIALGVAYLFWMVLGRLLLPGDCPVRMVLAGTGKGEGLEQTVKGLLWLQSLGVWRGVVVIEDRGLDPAGILLAQTLARQDGVEFTWK